MEAEWLEGTSWNQFAPRPHCMGSRIMIKLRLYNRWIWLFMKWITSKSMRWSWHDLSLYHWKETKYTTFHAKAVVPRKVSLCWKNNESLQNFRPSPEMYMSVALCVVIMKGKHSSHKYTTCLREREITKNVECKISLDVLNSIDGGL